VYIEKFTKTNKVTRTDIQVSFLLNKNEQHIVNARRHGMYIKVVNMTANLAPGGSNEGIFKGGTTNMRKKTKNGKMAY